MTNLPVPIATTPARSFDGLAAFNRWAPTEGVSGHQFCRGGIGGRRQVRWRSVGLPHPIGERFNAEPSPHGLSAVNHQAVGQNAGFHAAQPILRFIGRSDALALYGVGPIEFRKRGKTPGKLWKIVLLAGDWAAKTEHFSRCPWETRAMLHLRARGFAPLTEFRCAGASMRLRIILIMNFVNHDFCDCRLRGDRHAHHRHLDSDRKPCVGHRPASF